MFWILYSSILQLNYGQFWVVSKNLLYHFLKSMYGMYPHLYEYVLFYAQVKLNLLGCSKWS